MFAVPDSQRVQTGQIAQCGDVSKQTTYLGTVEYAISLQALEF